MKTKTMREEVEKHLNECHFDGDVTNHATDLIYLFQSQLQSIFEEIGKIVIANDFPDGYGDSMSINSLKKVQREQINSLYKKYLEVKENRQRGLSSVEK